VDLGREPFIIGLDYRLSTWRKLDHRALERCLTRGAAAGIKVLRLPLIWTEFQPDPHHFSDSCLRDLEAAMNTCAALRVRLLPGVFAASPDGPQFPSWATQDPSLAVQGQLRMLDTLTSYFRAHRALLAWEIDVSSVSAIGLATEWRTELLPAMRKWDTRHHLALGLSDGNLLRGGRDVLEGLGTNTDFIIMKWSGPLNLTALVTALIWRLIERRVLFVMAHPPSSDHVMQDSLRMLPGAGALGVLSPVAGDAGDMPEFAWEGIERTVASGPSTVTEPRTISLDPEDFYRDPETSWQTLCRG